MNFGSETIFTISRACGAFPFKISSDGVSVPKWRLCFCILLLAVVFSSSTLSILKQEFDRTVIHPNLKKCMFFKISMQFSAAVISFVLLYLRRNKLLTFVYQLKAIDAQLAGVGIRISYRPKYKWVDFLVIAALFILAVEDVRVSQAREDATLVSAAIVNSLHFISSVRYYGTINCMSEPAEEIIKRLETIVKFTKKSTTTDPVSFKTLSRLETMGKCAFDLSKSAQMINEIFGPQIFLVTSDLFARILGLCYVLANMAFYTSHPHFSTYIWQEILLAVLFTKTLLGPSSRVTKQFAAYHSTLYRKLLEINVESSMIAKLKFHLFSKRAIAFSGFGIFEVDLPLLHSMLAAITSYLVVLLQLQYSKLSAD